uniref:Small ribosomal subunit protein uS3c n=1 Tax=Hyalogonium fusiforme TaxID=2926373 RepID=A0A9E7V7N1_9CHLO|nr:ribosomal protein S3 [Hyalogonium fusiforme]
MGQKVHPLGFRVGITKKHQSQWFARFNKHKYSQSVLEDRMLRQTLSTLFPQLLNPVLKKVQKRDEESSIVPRITQIKIERGLIPYEIGIQIHAENCELIKSSIENLKINRDLVCKLQKTRRYLQHLRYQSVTDFTTISEAYDKSSESFTKDERALSPLQNKQPVFDLPSSKVPKGSRQNRTGNSPQGTSEGANVAQGQERVFNSDKKNSDFRFRPRTRLSKQQLRRQLLILKRLKKRQSIRRRYKQLVYKGLLLSKKGNTVLQKVKLPTGLSRLASNNLNRMNASMSNMGRLSTVKVVKTQTSSFVKHGPLGVAKRQKLRAVSNDDWNWGSSKLKQTGIANTSLFKSRIKKKFVSIFINRMNKTFLQALKESLKPAFCREVASPALGCSKKWNFSAVKNQIALKSDAQLTKLISVLEQKSLKKMEVLRKDFIAFGSISKAASFNYYEMLMFLKQLKEYVAFIKRKQKLQLTINKLSNEGSLVTTEGQAMTTTSKSMALSMSNAAGEFSPGIERLKMNSLRLEDTQNTLRAKAEGPSLAIKLNNIENECRKLKFIEYLKQLVKKHRSENIYLYLASIGEARRDLRKLQQFTKRHASFLFGLNLANTSAASAKGPSGRFDQPNAGKDATENGQKGRLFTKKVQERVSNVLENSSAKSDFEKTLQDIFLEQIEKQRTMYQDNAQLTPKISIKFYAVNSQSLKAKASVVADSVVDALEKRKAYRKVIKDAKEELMRTAGVKGVKIQVSGRLNGAEIARSEWVRAGRVPLQTLRANLDYSYKTANTIYGIVGVKVWIFKGYTKLI